MNFSKIKTAFFFIPTFKNRGSKAADEVGIPPQRGRTSGTPGFNRGAPLLNKKRPVKIRGVSCYSVKK